MRTRFLLLICLSLLLIPAAHAKRVALLIGNAGYISEKPLANPVRDARLLAKVLKDDLKFDDVKLVENADRARLIELIDLFQRQAAGAEAAVFYFSGHGMQDGGKRNYLLPVDARIQGEAGIRAYGVQAEEVVAALASAAPRVSVVILDACRDNPYAGAVRSGSKGLARMETNTDQELLIAYATRDGQVALDGRGNNSPYAAALAKHLKQAGRQPLLSLFDQVADDVKAQTGNQQRPTRYGDLKASTYLSASLATDPSHPSPPQTFQSEAPAPVRPAPITPPSLDPVEAAYWTEVKKNDDQNDYAAYLVTFPNGRYVEDANEYIKRDKQAKAAEKKLKDDQAWQKAQSDDNFAWQKAQSDDSFSSYSNYLKNYPSGRYVALSKLKRNKLRPPLIEPAMVRIPGKNYEMGKYEVTQEEWQSVMGNNPSGFKGCDDCPVEKVSWDDIQDYLKKLNTFTGQQYRLPTEDEWKHACGGGREQEYCGSNDPDAVGWHSGSNSGKTLPVGRKQSNSYGLYDMSGNVWEWVQDCYDGDCSNRVMRGGSWFSSPSLTRSATRYWYTPATSYDFIGFRLARDVRTF